MSDIQSEVIIWHHFPDEKPTESDSMILFTNIDENGTFVDIDWYIEGKTHMDYVVAWAVLPKGWKQ